MYYTMAYTEEPHSGFRVTFDSAGNEYAVGVSMSGVYRSKTYKDREDAKTAYMRIVTCVLDSTYTFEDRVKML